MNEKHIEVLQRMFDRDNKAAETYGDSLVGREHRLCADALSVAIVEFISLKEYFYRDIARLSYDNLQLTRQVTDIQKRCNELLEENRKLRGVSQ